MKKVDIVSTEFQEMEGQTISPSTNQVQITSTHHQELEGIIEPSAELVQARNLCDQETERLDNTDLDNYVDYFNGCFSEDGLIYVQQYTDNLLTAIYNLGITKEHELTETMWMRLPWQKLVKEPDVFSNAVMYLLWKDKFGRLI